MWTYTMQSVIDLAVPLSSTDHVLGPQDAPVTIIEYGDFECPLCKQAAPAVKLLLQRYEREVRFAYRHFPLEDAHPHALQAAEAAECAGRQEKFWKMHDLLFDNQQHLERKDLDEYAGRLGLELGRFADELDTRTHVQRIRDDIEGGRRSNVHGTPGFFVNGRIVDTSFGMRTLFEATQAALERR
jgi:protein-disulfide isomerase